MANVAPLLPGDPERLGAYRLVGRLGQGGQGTVYLARQPSGGLAAVKLLRAEWIRDPVARARFAREVAAAGKVAPFCTAGIIDARLDGDEPFVVSEFIDGPSLQAVVAKDGPLAGSALDRLAVATATALSAIHRAGVIHRDFKPGNVLIGPDGVRVIDFGIARSGDTAATLTSQMFGTPGYMAPEVVRGQPAGPPADVFAWAATMTFAATGTPPFHAPNIAAIIHQLTQGEPDLGTLGGQLRAIVSDCLAKDPAARPTAVDLLMRLLQAEPIGLVAQAGWHGQAGLPAQTGGHGQAAARQAGVSVPVAAPAAVIAPPRDWRETRVPPPAAPWPAGHPAAPRGGGYQMPHPGPGTRRPGGSAARRAAVIAGLAVLAVLGGLLVPRLIAGPSALDVPGSRPPGHAPSAAPSAASAKTAPPAPAAADAIPARFAGTWSGEAYQVDGTVKRWAATLVLPEGATSGTFTIPTIPCYATVTVTRLTVTRIVLSDTVDSDPSGRCAASGIISLDRTGILGARMFWQDAGDPANVAVGSLTRG